MAFFRRDDKKLPPAPTPTERVDAERPMAARPPPISSQKSIAAPPPKHTRNPFQDDPLLRPVVPDPPGTPRQRGHVPQDQAHLLRMQVGLADHIRSHLDAEVPLHVPLGWTPDHDKTAKLIIRDNLTKGTIMLPEGVAEQDFVVGVLNEVFGFGPLQPLITGKDVTEIMVNGPYIIFIEKKGILVESGHRFLDDDHVERMVKRIAHPLGRVVDYDNPILDARLPTGDRVNAIIRPCAIDGPSMTIRRFAKSTLGLDDLVDFRAMTPKMARFLRALIVSRRNIVVSGGTGSGKTTLINAMSQHIQDGHRVVTIEDAAELQLLQRNVVRLETKKPSPSSPSEITIRDCVMNALRMRPERIIIGECRGGEALDMLQAMNTGHEGSLTTVHSNAPRDCISRLETLVLMGGVDLPLSVVRRQIVDAVQFIVQASRLRDGSRKVTYITEVVRLEGQMVILNDIFRFVDQGDNEDGSVRGRHEATGNRPGCQKLLERLGFDLPPSFYANEARRRS